MSRLYVDNRYRGNHGIARYAREVIPRLPLPWSKLGSRTTPATFLDVINPARLRLQASDWLYSPGYAVGPTRAVQLPTVHDLIHIRGPRTRKTTAHRLYYEHILRPTLRRTGHVVTVSETTADDLREWLSGDGVVVHNTGNGCSDSFRPDGQRHEADRPYFIFVGNFKAHKNPTVLFRAMRHLPTYDLLVVTADTDVARALAARHSIADQVRFVSGVADEELAALYRGAQALVFPSLVEGFGLPVVEALRCRLPVVYFEGCRAVREICRGTQFAVANAYDPHAFAEAMHASAHDGSFPPLGMYSWDRVAAKVGQVVSTVTGCVGQ